MRPRCATPTLATSKPGRRRKDSARLGVKAADIAVPVNLAAVADVR